MSPSSGRILRSDTENKDEAQMNYKGRNYMMVKHSDKHINDAYRVRFPRTDTIHESRGIS